MNLNPDVRRRIGIAGVVAALTMFAALPATASADPVGDLLNDLGLGSGSGGSGGSSAGNPHAQGTVAKVDLSAPDGADDGGLLDDEEVVVGRSRAEQNDDGSYHGHVTILALFGEEIIGIDTDSGESAHSPFQPLQEGLLDPICSGTGNAVCVAVLPASSKTDGSGSENDFGVLTAKSTPGNDTLLDAGVAESNASLEEDGDCQTAIAGASVARADLLTALRIRILQSFAQSTACATGGGSQTNDSTIASINDESVPLPGDCAEGVNTGFGILSLVSVSCNTAKSAIGTDSASGGAEPLGAGVVGDDPPLAGANASNSDTSARGTDDGPNGADTDDGAGGEGTAGEGASGPGDDGGTAGEGAGAAAGAAQPGAGTLAFTGANVALLAIIGLALLGLGIGLSSRLVRRPLDRPRA